MNTLLSSNRTECYAALTKVLESPLKFAEIAALSEKCDLQNLEKRAGGTEKSSIYCCRPSLPACRFDLAICRVIGEPNHYDSDAFKNKIGFGDSLACSAWS